MEFIGQEAIVKFLEREILHAKKSNIPLPHCLFTGNPGMGKSTFSKLIANELGYELKSYTADKTWTPDVVFNELMSLDITGYSKDGIPGRNAKRYVIYMDEVHNLPSFDAWYTPLQDREIYSSRGVVSWLPQFTFIGATTEPTLPKPFIDRLPLNFRFLPYSNEDLVKIIRNTYKNISTVDAMAIAVRSRHTARIALTYAERYNIHKGLSFFDIWGIDDRGLTQQDRDYLNALREYNRPLSLSTISALIGVDKRGIERMEPYLKELGLIVVTAKGRMLCESDVVNRNGRGHASKV